MKYFRKELSPTIKTVVLMRKAENHDTRFRGEWEKGEYQWGITY